MDMRPYLRTSTSFEQLSLKDLLEARELYHVQLMQHPNVIATAVGRYRIRSRDSWPDEHGPGKVHGTGVRTMANSEVRPYSWPAILVFVSKWYDEREFNGGRAKYDPDEVVPKALFLPDGRRVPVCVIEAPKRDVAPPAPPEIQFPVNNIGGGYPIVADVQGQTHFATVACLVSDGHKAYALTNRHVSGDPGEVVFARLGGKDVRVGVSSAKQITRHPFNVLYPGWPGSAIFTNLDAGLIEIDDISRWSAQVREIGVIAPMADFSVSSISLSLVGCPVRGYGAASGDMKGEIQALFYRYKSQGGFEYVSDLLIGPRATTAVRRGRRRPKVEKFSTHPGDSGTLWLLEPSSQAPGAKRAKPVVEPLPLAMQWGANTLESRGTAGQSYVLATFLSGICSLLGVDTIRDWNLDQPDTWGAIGHFSIASRSRNALSARFPRLRALIKNNAAIITRSDADILDGDFKGMGSEAFVALADVPDFFWKHGKQGHSRGREGPNHFADMDQPRSSDGKTLLDLCKDPANIDPDVWNDFYESVTDLLSGEAIEDKHRGLLPFRVWQLFDEMVKFAKAGKGKEFLCAAGVLTHYVGDACQPLHISYLHDGDPLQPVTRTVHHRDGTSERVQDPLGKGVHAAYEDDMVFLRRQQILTRLSATPKVKADELISNGSEAARLTVDLMRRTFKAIPPVDIVNAFMEHGDAKAGRAEFFWKRFGTKTIRVMQDGTHLIALLWESAWQQGNGETQVKSVAALTKTQAMKICADADFVPSLFVDQIKTVLKKPQ